MNETSLKIELVNAFNFKEFSHGHCEETDVYKLDENGKKTNEIEGYETEITFVFFKKIGGK